MGRKIGSVVLGLLAAGLGVAGLLAPLPAGRLGFAWARRRPA